MSLGFSDSTDIDLVWVKLLKPTLANAAFSTEGRENFEEATVETYLAFETECGAAGDGVGFRLACDSRRLRIALFASFLARSIDFSHERRANWKGKSNGNGHSGLEQQ